jgi:hypothetical protein
VPAAASIAHAVGRPRRAGAGRHHRRHRHRLRRRPRRAPGRRDQPRGRHRHLRGGRRPVGSASARP